jgi:hypothetical protein
MAALRGAAAARGGVGLALHRRAVFEESFRALKSKSASEMRGPISVKFHGEEGVDAGALLFSCCLLLFECIQMRQRCGPRAAMPSSRCGSHVATLAT